MNVQGKKLKYYKLYAFKLLVFSSLALFLAVIVPFLPDTASWFQRSGSVMLGLCIYVEFSLMVVRGRLRPQKVPTVRVLDLIAKLQTWERRCSRLSKICIGFGFVIFGYGDLLY